MPGMRRDDRRDANDDNARRNIHIPQNEPTSDATLLQRLTQANSKRMKAEGDLVKIQSELEEKDKNLAEKSSQLVHIQQAFQTSQQEVEAWQEKSNEWLAKYEAAEAQSTKYLALYNEAQTQLKYERRSKAGIKGWETRRKQENQRLKQEIGEMTVLVRESLSRKDEALENLSLFADRMDKIQTLVDSIEGESPDNPIGLLQKFKRIWTSIKDILSE